MRGRSSLLSLTILAASLTFAGALADEDLPTLQTMPCEVACANSTGPVALEHRLPLYPREMLTRSTYVEGFVRLNYTINPDGTVSEIKTVSVSAPGNWRDITIAAVKDWTYKPATLDGKTVAINRTMEMRFRQSAMMPTGARETTVRAYEKARDLIGQNKLDDAQATLQEVQAEETLNLYERGMLANLEALIALAKNDPLEAHRLSTQALAHSSDELPPAVVRMLWHSRINSALALGDIADAVNALERLKTTKGFEANDSIVKYVADVRAKADTMAMFATDEKIPAADDAEFLAVRLYRRNFAFRNIKGSLENFSLGCQQSTIASKINDTAEWHVPKNWSDCFLFIHGTPGTTFELIQAQE